ncbi:hypothetical protein [Deinococcus soli (ex Cha et al. 2016)]|uniref:hypothetical protein n=1 Tax=Deinococcus soli (ex Cha et al. 2016) TaxID=1309411 RepID=UPI00166ACE4D|nr:hypothetical protein [Deinococcus soli (ex Cha et al. 2016)]GGB79869.1 hypothetical protein GCM10008019_40140 [Deinococcus soli (ex Cha et al. 2016)]
MAEYLTEREKARQRLKDSVDALTQQASLHAQMQKDPLKMLGGASAVGALMGIVVGRQFRRSRKIYVDAQSPAKHQKALMKAQKNQKGGGGVGGALVATLGTLAVKTLMDKVITPRLETFADGLLDKAGQPRDRAAQPGTVQKGPGGQVSPSYSSGVGAFTRTAPAASAQSYTQQASAEGSAAPAPTSSAPVSTVKAAAEGSPIAPDDLSNPNKR